MGLRGGGADAKRPHPAPTGALGSWPRKCFHFKQSKALSEAVPPQLPHCRKASIDLIFQ